MVTLFYAKISSIEYALGTANIALQERENQVIEGVPFLATYYEMPKPGEVIVVLFEEINGQIGKGVILGKLFLDENKPTEYGKDIFYKQFADGAGVKYIPDRKELEVKVKKVVVDEIEYKAAVRKGY